MSDHLSVSQTSAALGAATSQHLAAIAGSHALTEAVLLGTLALLGLIGTKHGGHLLIEIQAGSPGPTTVPLELRSVKDRPCGRCAAEKGHKNPLLKSALPIIDDKMSLCQPSFSGNFPKFFVLLG